MAMICGTEFTDFFNDSVVPLMAYSTLITSILIGLAYMVGNALANPKLTVWARTEAVQIAVSLGSVALILLTMNTFCGMKINEIAGVFGIPAVSGDPNVYTAAESYLSEAALYSHNALRVVRYHLEAYTLLGFLNAFLCDLSTGSIGWGCLFGYSGDNQQPLGGYGARVAAMNIFFNGALIAHFSALNFLFILLFIYKGFVFLFLPLGVFMRSMPYMRTFGSLLIAVAMSFLIVFPFLLGVMYLMRNTLLDAGTGFTPMSEPMSSYDEETFPEQEQGEGILMSMGAGIAGASVIKGFYLDSDQEDVPGVIMFASAAFVAAVFFPSVALLATIASVGYIARLFGEEIDLSRVTQMV